jgi:hypothetical protein
MRLKPKSKGKGIMISENIFEKFRYLKIVDDEQFEQFCAWRPEGHTHCQSWADVRMVDGTCSTYEEYPLFLGEGLYKDLKVPPRESLLLFEYGKSQEGYFNTDHFVRSQFAMLMLFEFLYPDSRLFSVYDNATIHRAKGAHALDASIMNLSPGGKQRKQRATTYTNLKTGARGVKQSLVDEHGVAKGLLAILLERGEQWTKTPSKKLAVAMLSEYDDFKDQASWIERIFRASPRGHQMIFAPKCHPELQYPIESSWAKMKGHLRRNCRHTLKALRENIIAALEPENIPLTLVQKWFRKMRDYMTAYEAGATGANADKAVKQHKRHREIYDKTPAGASFIPEVTRLVLRGDDSIIDLTAVIPTVEMVESAAAM